MPKDTRENRVPIMLSDEELSAIDDWRFANRVATRSEAIRRLCQMALFFGDRAEEMLADAERLKEVVGTSGAEVETVELALGLASDVSMLDMSRKLFSNGDKTIAMERTAAARSKLRELRDQRVAEIVKGMNDRLPGLRLRKRDDDK